ncbi:hypothetical protein Pta02_12020 [Planobispora takensis]|uniref:Uncharacterized protein n=2 Tax=Streptosporangiaceae TaxID=2004 RepID=A0A8J3T161_9ACTN|nr:hypothetical protein Pta02_12020 [Planobispora takensis]
MILFDAMRERRRRCLEAARRHPDRGSFSTETVIVTAILVAIAITAGAILLSKVLAKVNSIDLG